MPTIEWTEGDPAGSESLGLGDNRIRSLKSSVRVGLDAEHVWPSASGDAGVHRQGSARPYYGTQSLVSSTGTDARLMQTSDTSRLFGVGSGGTTFLGGPTAISAGSYPGTVPQRAIWVEEFGQGKTVSGLTTVSFPNSGFSTTPFVQITAYNTNIVAQIMTLTSVSATQFGVRSCATDLGGTSSTTFFWRAIGQRTL